MTTNVTIDAHLANTKEVCVTIKDTNTNETTEAFTLQDGQSASRCVYDDKEITISEVTKQ